MSELENSSKENIFIDKGDFDELIISLKKRINGFSDEITGRKIANILFYISKLILNHNSIISKFVKSRNKFVKFDFNKNPELTTLLDMMIELLPDYLDTCSKQELANICYSFSNLRYKNGIDFLA